MDDKNSQRKPLEDYREEFPVTQKHVYLDHAGIAPLPLRVARAVEHFLAEASAFGAFRFDRWMHRIEPVRERAETLLNAAPDDVAFVKNTSHGLSIVAEGLEWESGDNVLVYEKEFPSNVYPWLNLARKGVEVRYIPSRSGRIRLEDIARLIDSRTKLLTISSVQFSNGFKVDLSKVGALCKAKGVLFALMRSKALA